MDARYHFTLQESPRNSAIRDTGRKPQSRIPRDSVALIKSGKGRQGPGGSVFDSHQLLSLSWPGQLLRRRIPPNLCPLTGGNITEMTGDNRPVSNFHVGRRLFPTLHAIDEILDMSEM